MNGLEHSPERPGAEPRRNDDGLAALEARLAGEAQKLRLGGHQAFFLEPAETAWWVVEGRIELFALTAPDDERPGRIHVATFSARQMLFSPLTLQRRSAPEVAGEAPPRRFLAAPTPGTRLLRLSVAGLKRLARDEALAPALARSIETWLEKLGSELEKERPPKLFQELEAGKELTLEEPGTVARSRRGLVWVRHVAGSSEFLGRPELPMHQRSFLLPISEHTWLVSREATRLSAVSTDLLLRGGTLWEGLERFHRLVLAQIDIAFEQRHEDDKARFERQAELDHKTLQGAYARLTSILGTALDATPVAAGEVDDPLLSACRLIGHAQGFEVELPPGGPPSGTVQRRLNRLCAASRVRSRRTILRDDWWRRDNGPLLAFLSAAEASEAVRPVALLPTSPRSYRLVDPAGSSRPVDAAVAEELEGEAFMFYPPLPERPLVLRDLLRAALRDQRFDLRTILMMGLAGGLLGTLTPILTGVIFGQVVPNANRPLLFQMTLALVLSAFAGAAFQITRSIAVLRLSGKIDGSLQAAIWDRLLSLPTRFFRNFTVGDLTNRAMGADAIRELLTGHVTTSLLVSFFSIFSFALLFYYSWVLALIATLIVAILGTVSIGFALLQLKHQRKLLAMQGKISSLLFGLIHGIAKLRISGAEPRAFALWAEQFTEQRRETWASRRIANLQGAVNAAYPLLSIGGIFAMVGFSAQVGLSVSDFLAFNVAFGQFQAAFLSILGLIPSVLSVVPIYERLTPILETAPEVDPSKADAGELAGDIEFSHISFRYKADGPSILDDVSFRVRPGEFIALVGPSGSGKSTCLRLLLGFEQPSSGSIYFDGQDLPSLDMPSVRQQIGVVLQNGRPLVGDIFSNIVGSRNLGIDEAWEAARMAGLDEDIKSMPMGMHTIISEGGGTFSGGQQQRLMIARAIVHRPRILLFDEATSALDNRTQDIVSRSLESLKASRIVVAHRLSTILNADRIYVIEKGRVVDSGTYEELVARGGLFSRLAQRQIA